MSRKSIYPGVTDRNPSLEHKWERSLTPRLVQLTIRENPTTDGSFTL
jgi:hypothetical protein